MKKMMLIALAALMVSPLFICSCAEKTTEEKAADAVEQAKKDGEKAVEDAKDAAKGALDALKK